MKDRTIIVAFILVVIGGIVLLWPQKPERTDADFKLIENENSEVKSSSRQVALQEELSRENLRLERKTTNRKVPQFTAVGRLGKLEFSNMGMEIIKKIKESMASGSVLSKPQDESEPIETIEEAFDFINVRVNMAYVPEKYLEGDDAFYFSGGTTAQAVLDFSSGIAVNKKDRTITSWKFTP